MIVVAEGPNACGKTTFQNMFKQAALKHGFNESEFVTLDIKDLESSKGSVSDRLHSRNTFNMPVPVLLRLVANHITLIELAKDYIKTGTKIVLLARSIPSFLVYQYYHDNKYEMVLKLYKDYLEALNEELVHIYLRPPLELLTRRLEARGDANHLLESLPLITEGYDWHYDAIKSPDYLVRTTTEIEWVISDLIFKATKR